MNDFIRHYTQPLNYAIFIIYFAWGRQRLVTKETKAAGYGKAW